MKHCNITRAEHQKDQRWRAVAVRHIRQSGNAGGEGLGLHMRLDTQQLYDKVNNKTAPKGLG